MLSKAATVVAGIGPEPEPGVLRVVRLQPAGQGHAMPGVLGRRTLVEPRRRSQGRNRRGAGAPSEPTAVALQSSAVRLIAGRRVISVTCGPPADPWSIPVGRDCCAVIAAAASSQQREGPAIRSVHRQRSRSPAVADYGADATAMPHGLPPRLIRRSTVPGRDVDDRHVAGRAVGGEQLRAVGVDADAPRAAGRRRSASGPACAGATSMTDTLRARPFETNSSVRVGRQHGAHRPRRRRRRIDLRQADRRERGSAGAASTTEIDAEFSSVTNSVLPSGRDRDRSRPLADR